MLTLTAGLLAPTAAHATKYKTKATHKAEAIRIEVPTPASGDVTIEGITTTIPSHVAKFPKLQLFASNDRALPPDVIALTATRTERDKRSTTFRTVVLVLDRRSTATTARAASDDELAEYGRRLVGGDEPEKVKGSPSLYAGLSFGFTQMVPADIDTWLQEQHNRHLLFIDVGAQPNANAGATDMRACWELTDTMRVGSSGKPAPGVIYGFFDGPGSYPWSQSGIGSTFVHFAEDCHAGAGGLNSVFTAVDNDLRLGLGALGPAQPTPPLAPIGEEQSEAIFLGAILNDEPRVAWKALEDFALWEVLEELEEFFLGSDGLRAPGPFDRAHAASARAGTVPQNGQVTKIEVRGYYLGGCPVAEEVCEDNLHFQDLRPLPGGEVEVISTTQAFTLPKTPGTYSFEPTNFYVQKGDYIGLSTVGGEFEVLISAPGAQIDVFEGDREDMNGAKLSTAKTQSESGDELNMRVTLKPSK